MWIFTTLGFFSVVAHRDKPDRLCVRARNKLDITALRIKLGKPRPKIIETPEADYPFRMIVNRERFAGAMSNLVRDTLYDNFKNQIYKQDPDREATYHDVWTILKRTIPR